MLIDWFTVAAQIINFLILILLLRRFLYRPVIRVMNEREAKIAAQLAEAEALKQEAIDEAEAYQQQRRELQNHREELLAEARDEAEAWRKELISKARKEIDEARASWRKSIAAEQQVFTQEVRQRIGRQVCTISRRALADLADTELEERVIEVFIRRLRALDEDEHELLAESVRQAGNKITLRTAFEISPAAYQKIVQTIQTKVEGSVVIQSEVVRDLLCGVEISSPDYKLSWTLDDYLDSLESSLLEAFGEEVEWEYAE
jgi:F-type H+-transporting ATPase subunit b